MPNQKRGKPYGPDRPTDRMHSVALVAHRLASAQRSEDVEVEAHIWLWTTLEGRRLRSRITSIEVGFGHLWFVVGA